MKRRHPRVLYLYWSKSAYERTGDPYAWFDVDEDDPDSEPPTSYSPRALFPLIKVERCMRTVDLHVFFEGLKCERGVKEEIPVSMS